MKKATAASIIIASSLLVSTLNPVITLANEASNKTIPNQVSMTEFKGAILKTVNLTSKSFIQLKDVYFKYGSKDKQVFFTLKVHNGDNTTINFMDYWVELSSTTGAKYPVKSFTQGDKSTQVAPNTTKDFTFYSQIDSKLNYSNLIFKLVKWDFSLPNYTKTLGQANVSSSYKNAVPVNSYHVNTDDNNKIKSYLSSGNIFNIGTQNQFSIDLNLENKGLYEFNLPDYQFYIRTRAGLVLKLAKDHNESLSIAPGELIKFTLRSSVKTNIDLTGAQILVTSLDAESKLEMPKSIYNINWNSKNNITIEENKSADINVDGINIKSSIENIYTDYSGTQNNVVLTTKWLNTGRESVILPTFKYEIMSKDGVRYPVTQSESSGEIQLVPGVEKEITLQAILPSTLTDSITMLIKQPKDEKNTMEYVKSAFKLSKMQETVGVSSKIYKNDQGTYDIKISQAERLPWGNQDMINTFVEVKNIGTKSQSIPDLAAILRLNGQLIDNEKTNFIQLDNAGLIEPSETTRFVLTTKVPYTYKFNEISLNLTDQVSESKKQTIGLFKQSKMQALPEISISDDYSISTIGRRSSLEFMNTYLFKGKDQDLIYAEFKYTNNESRNSQLPVLKAYFKTSDGQYIDANLQNIKSGIKPNGTAILTAVAPIPKTIVHDGGIQLLIGEALSGSSYTTTDGTPDGFISAKAFKLPKDQTKVNDTIAELKVDPYTFTLNRLNTMLIDVRNVKLDITYTMQKSAVYNVVEKETKLYFEITDGRNTYGSSVVVEPKEGEGLEVGEELKIELPIAGAQLGNIVHNGYLLNVYEEVDGFKRLLGTKKYGSFQIIG